MDKKKRYIKPEMEIIKMDYMPKLLDASGEEEFDGGFGYNNPTIDGNA